MPTTVKYPEPEPLDESEKETEPDPITHRLNEMAEGIEKRAEEREERMGQGFARMLFDHAKEIETTLEEGNEKIKHLSQDVDDIQEQSELGATAPDSGGAAGDISIALGSINDVDVSGVADGALLKYTASTGTWEFIQPAEITVLTDMIYDTTSHQLQKSYRTVKVVSTGSETDDEMITGGQAVV